MFLPAALPKPNLRFAFSRQAARRVASTFAARHADALPFASSGSLTLPSDVWTATDLHSSSLQDDDDAWYRTLTKLSEDMTAASTASRSSSSLWTATGDDVWSRELSYASPESDFVAANVANGRKIGPTEWSNELSYASPESDFVAANVANSKDVGSAEWSHELSFASPESDFVAANVANGREIGPTEWSEELSYASPESDFVAANVANQNEEYVPPEWSRTLSYATPESDFAAELQTSPLPRTVSRAMADPRAVVITSSVPPFRVASVNDAWVGLCGYAADEAVGRTLGELLQGPNTDRTAVADMMRELRQQHYAEGVVQNYTKQKREFRNFVRLAPIRNDVTGEADQLIGVLHEIGYGHETKNHLMQG